MHALLHPCRLNVRNFNTSRMHFAFFKHKHVNCTAIMGYCTSNVLTKKS